MHMSTTDRTSPRKDSRKEVRTSVRLPPETREALRLMAFQRRSSQQQLMREAIQQFVHQAGERG